MSAPLCPVCGYVPGTECSACYLPPTGPAADRPSAARDLFAALFVGLVLSLPFLFDFIRR